MIGQENRRPWVPKTVELPLTAGLAAIYAITAYLPLSKFIGGPRFITLEIVILPIIAALVRPPLAVAAVFVGSLVAGFGKATFVAAFCPLELSIPLLRVWILINILHFLPCPHILYTQ